MKLDPEDLQEMISRTLGHYHNLPVWRDYLVAAGFAELEHYYRLPGLPRDRQPWLASVLRRMEPTGDEGASDQKRP